jgi:hypothetical protein
LPAAIVSVSQDGIQATVRKVCAYRPELRTVVLDGSAPPEHRNEVFSAIRNGHVDVLVCTTLIAHGGVDVDFRTVLFSETRSARKSPTPMELAWIASRSFEAVGHTCPDKRRKNVSFCSRQAVRHATEVASGVKPCSDVDYSAVYVVPKDPPQGWELQSTMSDSISKWSICQVLDGLNPTTDRLWKRAKTLERLVADGSNVTIDADTLWKIATLPVKEKNFDLIARIILSNGDGAFLLSAPRWDMDVSVVNDLRIVRLRMPDSVHLPEWIPSIRELNARYRDLVCGIWAGFA